MPCLQSAANVDCPKDSENQENRLVVWEHRWYFDWAKFIKAVLRSASVSAHFDEYPTLYYFAPYSNIHSAPHEEGGVLLYSITFVGILWPRQVTWVQYLVHHWYFSNWSGINHIRFKLLLPWSALGFDDDQLYQCARLPKTFIDLQLQILGDLSIRISIISIFILLKTVSMLVIKRNLMVDDHMLFCLSCALYISKHWMSIDRFPRDLYYTDISLNLAPRELVRAQQAASIIHYWILLPTLDTDTLVWLVGCYTLKQILAKGGGQSWPLTCLRVHEISTTPVSIYNPPHIHSNLQESKTLVLYLGYYSQLALTRT